MRNTLIYLFLLLGNIVQAQIRVKQPLSFPDFFGIDVTVIGRCFLNDELLYKDFEKIEVDDKIIAVRKFFPNQKVVEGEYTFIDKNTYLYVKYDSLTHHILEKGKLSISNCCSRIDTIRSFDPDTYEEINEFHKFYNWSKEGFWRESFGFGKYKNNLKVGEWFYYGTKEMSAKIVQHDKDSVNVSMGTFDKAKGEIYENWKIIELSDDYIYLMPSKNNDRGYYGTFAFNVNTINFEGINWYCLTNTSNRLVKQTKWTLSNDFIINTEDEKHLLNNSKIRLLSKYEMIIVLKK